MNVQSARVVVASSLVTELPMTQRKFRRDMRAARRDDLLRTRLAGALRASGRYAVRRDVRVPLSAESRRWVRQANGAYLGVSLPCGDHAAERTLVDMVVIDQRNGWAGGYSFCWGGSQSSRARRRIARDLRAVELVLSDYLFRALAPVDVATVTVGIIDGAANNSDLDDLTISLNEIPDHFDIDCILPEISTPPLGSGTK